MKCAVEAPEPNRDDLMSMTEAMEFLGVSHTTVRFLLDYGQIETIKEGLDVWVSRSSAEAWKANRDERLRRNGGGR